MRKPATIRKRWVWGMLLVSIVWAAPAFGQRQAVDQANAHVQEAIERYKAGDYAASLEQFVQAAELRPNHPGLTYNIAALHARVGHPDEALAWLNRYAAMGLVAAPGADEDFAAIQDTDGFTEVLARIDANAQPVGNLDEAFHLDDPRFIPEGLAYDAMTGAFFVGSVHQRRVVRVDTAGAITTFADAERHGLWSVLGVAVDAEPRRLWVASPAMAETRDLPEEEQGGSKLLQFDLDTGALVKTYAGPAGVETVLGDLTVGPDGQVWATDGRSGALYRIDPGTEQMEPFLEPQTLVSPQGLCFLGDELVVADYSLGLVVVDPVTRGVEVIPPPQDETLLGIDGLACYRGDLIAIQNGIRPHRVIRFSVNETVDRVTGAEVLAAGDPRFDEPTLGTVVDDAFYFVANSQWSRFDEDGHLPDNAADLHAPVILKVALP